MPHCRNWSTMSWVTVFCGYPASFFGLSSMPVKALVAEDEIFSLVTVLDGQCEQRVGGVVVFVFFDS